jgi:hypothetical protein
MPARRRGSPESVVDVLVRFAPDFELTMDRAHPPSGEPGQPLRAARELMERSVPAGGTIPRTRLVPFGARRTFEATIGEIAGLVRDVRAALAGVVS